MIDKKRPALFDRIQGNRFVTGTAAKAAEGGRLGAIRTDVGLGSDQFAVGGETPKIGSVSFEVRAGELAERAY
jgi:hypothetical protein